MTTANYLESLQDDLSRTVEALDLEEGTNFTDIAEMAENGDISTGGGGADLSEYFNYQPAEMYIDASSGRSWVTANYFLKMPDLIVPSTTTILNYLLVDVFLPVFPKVICGNQVTSFQNMYSVSYTLISSVNQQYIQTIDLTGLDTSNVTTMQGMFYGRTKLTSLNFSNFDTRKVTTMASMFYSCSSLTQLDLSSFETPLLTATNLMFSGCSFLTKIDMRKFDFSNVTTFNNMFQSVRATCLIIVADQTQKSWINTNFSNLTNVKTVEEYEAS